MKTKIVIKPILAGGLFCALIYVFINTFSKTVHTRSLSSKSYKDVVIQNGTVRGWVAADGDYVAFLGIPYAAPPVGKMRFKPPAPPNPWQGVFNANRTVRCPQQGTGDEDCLIVNVFTPMNKSEERLPVLVYIHGGSYLIGVGQTKGVELLTQENIIVVTLNYRLGIFGFLCLGIEEAPGNAGLKDQLAALKWVNSNIASFGGDPDNVTLYGMSAGSSSVNLHLMCENSKGLFKKAIMESAATTAVFGFDPTPLITALDFAEIANFKGDHNNLDELVEFFQTLPANDLSKMNYDFYYNFTDGRFGFVPSFERKIDNNNMNNFLLESPKDLIKMEKYEKMPTLIMFTTLEGLHLISEKYYTMNYKDRMEENFAIFLPADLQFHDDDNKKEVANYTRQFYFGNDTIGDSNLINFLNFFGDYFVLHGIINLAKEFSKDGNPVYLMEFGYKGKMGSYEKFYEDFKIAGHGDIVKHAILEKSIQNEEDQLAVDRVVKIISNFVKHGNPIPHKSTNLPIVWPQVDPNALNYLYVNKHLRVLNDPYHERVKFWDELYSQYQNSIKSPWT